MKENDSDTRYFVPCPVCGRQLMRSRDMTGGIKCGGCRKNLEIFVQDGFLCVLEADKADRRALECLVSRTRAYGEAIAGVNRQPETT